MAPLEDESPGRFAVGEALALAAAGGDATVSGDGAAAAADAAEEAHYEAHREALLEALRAGQGGRLRLQERGEGGVGLLNQGATCYMNSLLQALFFEPEFRSIIYRWQYDPSAHGEASRCIPLQLQRLFAQLQLTRASAVSTTPLTAAFGFSASTSREQHDVQELCRVLFDALGRSAPALATAIDRLYSGRAVHFLRSKEAAPDGHFPESRREESFSDLQVPIQGCRSLEQALRRLVDTEVLDGGNQWHCDVLSRKVDAVKGMAFEALPGILCLQLLRFVFDVATMRRQKLQEKLEIPLEVDLGFLLGASGAGPARYELAAVCCHSGTAHGGHYHALLREAGGARRWRDANDASVRLLGPDQEAALFSTVSDCADGAGAADAAGAAERKVMQSSDAYFLVYRRVDLDPEAALSAEVPDEAVPEPHRSELLAENALLADLRRAYDFHRHLTEVTVYAPTAPGLALRRYVAQQLRGGLLGPEGDKEAARLRDPQRVVLSVPAARAVAEVRQQAVAAFLSEAEKGGDPWPWSMQVSLEPAGSQRAGRGPRARLRAFCPTTGEAGAPLDDSRPLGEALKVGSSPSSSSSSCVLLDVRLPGDSFESWDPNDERVAVCCWDSDRGAPSVAPRDVALLRLPREAPVAVADAAGEGPAADVAAGEGACVRTAARIGSLRTAAAMILGYKDPGQLSLVALTGCRAGSALTLSEDAQDLAATLQGPGSAARGSLEVVCAEPAGGADSVPLCAALFERVRNTATIAFNHPDRPEYTEEFQVSVSKAPQLKDEDKTLRAAGLADAGHIFVGHGAPCLADEFLLRVQLHGGAADRTAGGSKLRELFSHPVRASASVRSLREALVEPLRRWAASEVAGGEDGAAIPFDAAALTWRRLRLRDGQAGRQLAILRDDRTVRSALLGLVDGRQLAVQVLSTDEELTPEDLILQVRPWRYHEGKLHAPSEFIFRRTRPLHELREELSIRFAGLLMTDADAAADAGDAGTEAAQGDDSESTLPPWSGPDRLELVAVPSVGPPLSIKRCAGLKWAESSLNSTDDEDLQRPVEKLREGLRDGATLVVRSGRRASVGPPAEPPAGAGGVAAGAAASKAGAGRPRPPFRASSGGPVRNFGPGGGAGVLAGARPKERALVIEVAHPEQPAVAAEPPPAGG